MKIPKYNGRRWDAAERQARKDALSAVKTKHGQGNSVPDLRARIDRIEVALGMVK